MSIVVSDSKQTIMLTPPGERNSSTFVVPSLGKMAFMRIAVDCATAYIPDHPLPTLELTSNSVDDKVQYSHS